MKKSKLDKFKDEILIQIEDCVPKAQIAQHFNCNIKTLNFWLKQNNINYNGNQGAKNHKTYTKGTYVPYKEYIKKCKVQSNKLRKKTNS